MISSVSENVLRDIALRDVKIKGLGEFSPYKDNIRAVWMNLTAAAQTNVSFDRSATTQADNFVQANQPLPVPIAGMLLGAAFHITEPFTAAEWADFLDSMPRVSIALRYGGEFITVVDNEPLIHYISQDCTPYGIETGNNISERWPFGRGRGRFFLDTRNKVMEPGQSFQVTVNFNSFTPADAMIVGMSYLLVEYKPK